MRGVLLGQGHCQAAAILRDLICCVLSRYWTGELLYISQVLAAARGGDLQEVNTVLHIQFRLLSARGERTGDLDFAAAVFEAELAPHFRL